MVSFTNFRSTSHAEGLDGDIDAPEDEDEEEEEVDQIIG